MTSEVPAIQMPRIRPNYLAILVAAIACFLLEAAWYSFFLQAWLAGIGRSREWLMSTGVSAALQYGTAIIAAALVAGVISGITQFTGPQTALRGIKIAVVLWAGLVLTTWSTEYTFEVRPFNLLCINAGFWLLGMVVEGAIVGGWKKK